MEGKAPKIDVSHWSTGRMTNTLWYWEEEGGEGGGYEEGVTRTEKLMAIVSQLILIKFKTAEST